MRNAKEDDIPRLLELGKMFSDIAHEPWDTVSARKHIRSVLSFENTALFVAEVDGEIQGMVAGATFPTFWDENKLTASEIWWFVHPQCQGKGVGGALMDALESWAKDAGAWRLSMMTIVGIAPQVEEIYKKRGFREREKAFLKEL